MFNFKKAVLSGASNTQMYKEALELLLEVLSDLGYEEGIETFRTLEE